MTGPATISKKEAGGISPLISPDSDYNTGLVQIVIDQEGAFRGTRSRVAIPFNYDKPLPQQEALYHQNHWGTFSNDLMMKARLVAMLPLLP